MQSNQIVHTMNNQQKANKNNNQTVPSVDNKNQKDTTDEMNTQSSSQQQQQQQQPQQVCAHKFITLFLDSRCVFVCLFYSFSAHFDIYTNTFMHLFINLLNQKWYKLSKLHRWYRQKYQKQMKYINMDVFSNHIKIVLHSIDEGKKIHVKTFIWILIKEMITDKDSKYDVRL